MSRLDSPVVIGGSGGSGTRVFASICMLSGFHMGERLNESTDALVFVDFLDRWLNRYRFGYGDLNAVEQADMRAEFQHLLDGFIANVPDGSSWGWKNPRSMLALPFLNEMLPRMRFVHVVRDGRDMVNSNNTNQLTKHASVFLSEQGEHLTAEGRAMSFWSKSNCMVSSFGESRMGDRYMRIRFEDLFIEPVATVQRLSSFIERPILYRDVEGIVRMPDSIGRWRQQSERSKSESLSYGIDALRCFGYLK